MTISELEASMDYGFHDALLHEYAVDIVARIARFRLELCVGDPSAADYASREARCMGTLILTGVEYVASDLPDFTYDRQPPFLVDLCEPAAEEAANAARTGKFAARFYSSSTNSFIHFSAASAAFEYDHLA